jgi:starch phosphorylase
MPLESTWSLARLAYNLRWAWHAQTAELFHCLAPDVWDATHNPVAVMRAVADTPDVLAAHTERMDAAVEDLDNYLTDVPRLNSVPRVAYFSAEFAVAECLPIYSGGLGVLAGDHLKAASDLGAPLLGVGLLYRYGYFRQRIDADGRQREEYDRLDPDAVPLRLAVASEGVPLEIAVPFPGRLVRARAWVAQVGRVPLYLLDTDLTANREDDRWIAGHLYGGDRDTRLRQEMVLGIGGARLIRALTVLGLEVAPEVYHLNEGHSALVAVELAAERLRTGAAADVVTAHQQVAERVAFTTHTPVSAGHDSFPSELVEAYLAPYRADLGLGPDQFMALGRRDPGGSEEDFSMTILALRSAHARNGVSQLHGIVSRELWGGVGVGLWNLRPRVEMDAITNGVHTPTWAGPEMSALFDRHLGRSWRVVPQEGSVWARLTTVEPRRLWAARTAQRQRLLEHVDARARRDGLAGLSRDLAADRVLVVGFARRFATYKRAGLLLEDPARLAQLLDDPARPVVLVFAGKAHPQDEPGKLLVQRIVEASREVRFRGRLLFLADYDVELARLLVQGSDVWLNTPRRPMEASGTSGMKATLNGALHISSLDGWWDEAYAPELGWALGEGIPEDADDEARDRAESHQLMHLLETEIVPLFYERGAAGWPAEWLWRAQQSMQRLAGAFSAHRMVDEYVKQIYRPVAHRAVVGILRAGDGRPDTAAA